MWQDLLNASLRDNLTLLATIIGSLSGLSVLLSLGWLRRAKNSSQTILALEDENKQFRLDFIRAQTRLERVDPAIIGAQLQGQDRLPKAEDRAQLAQTYLDLQRDTVTAAALNLAAHDVFTYDATPASAVAQARQHLALARWFDPDNADAKRLRAAVDGLEAVIGKEDTPLAPEIFTLPDTELQKRALQAAAKGRLEEGLYLSMLCVQKAEQRTGDVSDNHAGALHTLVQNQAKCKLFDDAQATYEKELDIVQALFGPDSVDALFVETTPGYILTLQNQYQEALAYFEDMETAIETRAGGRNNAAMVHCLTLRALVNHKLGRLEQAEQDKKTSAAIYDYLKQGGHPALKYLGYDPRTDYSF